MADAGPGRPSEPVRVFLVDDHDVVRSSVRDLMQAGDDIVVVGEDGSSVSAPTLILAAAPAVAVVDLRLGDGSGIEVCRDVIAGNPDIATVLLTADDDDRAAIAAVLAGARGYALKMVRGSQLLAAVHLAAQGRRVLAPERELRARSWLVHESARIGSRLPGPHTELLDLIMAGRSNADIAAELGLASATISSRVSALVSELGFSARALPSEYARSTERPWV